MEDVLLHFEKYREEDFSKSMDFAKTVSLEMNVKKCRKYENAKTVSLEMKVWTME
jgi:hypothetical protein